MNTYDITILIWYGHNFLCSVTMATPIGKKVSLDILAASLRSRDGCEALSNVSVWLQALEVKCMEFIPESVSVCLKLRQLQWNVVIET